MVVAAVVMAQVSHATPGHDNGNGNGSGHGHHGHAAPVGLSLWFDNGEIRDNQDVPKSVDLYENFPRYVQELDVTAEVVTDTDQGITPLMTSSEMADLDWSGVEMVDEDWRPEFTGGFTRSRFYRGAKWMERHSVFALLPVDANNHPVGPPLFEDAGSDNKMKKSDDSFIRRFDARQVVPGCQAIGDCSNATTYLVQGLVQLRGAMDPQKNARKIPQSATKLALFWTEQPNAVRYANLNHRSYDSTPYTYGLNVTLDVVNAPGNGQYFMPGEGLDLRVTFRDGAGNRLHPEGSLPNYLEFINNQVESGLRQYDSLRQLLTLYYAMKHREGLMEWGFSGPTDKVHNPDHEIGMFDFFAPQTDAATVAEDGFTAVVTLNPSMLSIAVPELWGAPVSDTVHFVIPADALPGTYTATVKGRRDWGGEALNRAGVATFQVGQTAPSVFQPKTGNCQNCHTGEASLSKVLHGLGDRRTCNTCHSKMAFEPDHALDYRIHLIHSHSDRFSANEYQCSTCHLTPPPANQPPKGFPGIGPFLAPIFGAPPGPAGIGQAGPVRFCGLLWYPITNATDHGFCARLSAQFLRRDPGPSGRGPGGERTASGDQFREAGRRFFSGSASLRSVTIPGEETAMAQVKMISARTSLVDPDAAADELLSGLGGATPKLVSLFVDCMRDQSPIARAVRARLPRETRLIGASTSAAIDNEGFHPGAVLMTALTGDLEIGVGLGTGLTSDASAAGAAAVTRALSELGVKGEDLDPKKHVGLVIDDGHKFKKEELLLGVVPEAPSLTLVGGGATHVDLPSSGVVHLDGEVAPDAVLIVVARTNAPWAALRHHAYRPTGEKLTITKIDPTCTMALEIDGKPAAQAYADRLGIGVDDLEFGKPKGFADRPTAMRVGREYFLRAPWKPLPDGSILFGNLLREGTELELMALGDMAAMLGDFFRDELPSRVQSPSATMLFNCSGRYWVAKGLGAEAGLSEAFSKAPPVAGMNCAFELYNGFQINSTLTVLSFGANNA